MSLKNIRNLDYVTVLCKNLDVMCDFYRNVLEFQIDEKECLEDWIQFRVGSGLLCLRPHGRWYDGSSVGEGASIQLSFRLAPDDIETVHKLLVDRSVEILEPPTDQPFGHRTLYFKDPENNILEIYAEI